jgi:NTE family protein
MSGKTIGLALGGGGARGLAHLMVLEVLEEYGVRPAAISGSSIGAVIGVLYSSGIKPSIVREYVDSHFKIRNDPHFWKQDSRNVMKIVKLLDIDLGGTGLIKGESFTHFLYEILETENFEDLEIPMAVVATDLVDSSQVVFREGPIMPAVKASMSVPGVFSPVLYQNRILVDGACVNPVPWDQLPDCDILIGVNVLGRGGKHDPGKPPKAARVVLDAFDVLQRSIVAEKFRNNPPDLLLDPVIAGVGLLEFNKADEVYRQSEPIIDDLKRFLDSALKA